VRSADFVALVVTQFAKRLHELLQEFAGCLVCKPALRIEKLVRAADVDLRLLHRQNVQKHQRLPQVMVRAKSTDWSGRGADHRAWFSVPGILAVWS